MRQLTAKEIDALQLNNCSATDWTLVRVVEEFDPTWCHFVAFVGECHIGNLSGSRTNEYGVTLHNGLYYATLHNCRIGNHVHIDHVHECISNYTIGDGTTISNICTLGMTGESTFGNGYRLEVLSETGGIEVIITDLLSAQTAYMQAFMNDNTALIDQFQKLSRAYAASVKSDHGEVGRNVTIKNAGKIVNARIGDHTTIEGASILENCSLNSVPDHPIYVGQNVMGHNFIASSGAKLSGGCVIHNCFIGQSTRIDRLFSAENSLFFANCQCENGEGCAVFAGPYTVSMHKSSLLIAGHFSFLNAGSGSNQSNHLYKLGPMHHGIVERGSKTTSDSYVLWPSHIAPFSLIMGRHVQHVDTSDFPFSYVIENDNESYLVPGANLRSIGTIRDAKKWPLRDKRPSQHRLDCINFNLLSPFTIGKMERGHHKLNELKKFIGHHGKTYIYKNIHIRSTSLENGIRTYDLGIKKFIGNSLIQQLQGHQIRTEADLRTCLRPQGTESHGEWIDLSGMLAPKHHVQQLVQRIASGELPTLEEINNELRSLHRRYYHLEWDWSYHLMCRWYGIKHHNEITVSLVTRIINDWLHAVVSIDRALYSDASKEYEIACRLDMNLSDEPSTEANRSALFDHKMETNPIVQEVLSHIQRKEALGHEVLERLASISH